jgi:hypothetical protein
MVTILYVAAFLGSMTSWADSPTPKLDAFLAGNQSTEAMRSHARAISKSLGVDLEIPDPSDVDSPAQLSRTLSQLDTTGLATALDEVKAKCGLDKGKTIEVGTSYYTWTDGMALDMSDPRIVSHLSSVANQCEHISKTLDQMNAAIAPRKFTVPFDRVFQGSITPAQVDAWKAAAPKVAAAADAFEKNCKQKTDKIGFENFDEFGISKSSGQELNVGDGPAAAIKRITRASNACAKVFPALNELAEKAGVSRHILIYASPEDFFRGELSADQALRWVKYFEEDPSRLDRLRSAVLKAGRPSDFPGIADCPPGAPEDSSKNKKHLIAVRMGSANEVEHHDGLTTVFMIFNPAIGLISLADEVINGPEVDLDVRGKPSVPDVFKAH